MRLLFAPLGCKIDSIDSPEEAELMEIFSLCFGSGAHRFAKRPAVQATFGFGEKIGLLADRPYGYGQLGQIRMVQL